MDAIGYKTQYIFITFLKIMDQDLFAIKRIYFWRHAVIPGLKAWYQ
jgi:hypothetical protein